jgi:hypothetical protein
MNLKEYPYMFFLSSFFFFPFGFVYNADGLSLLSKVESVTVF